MGTLGSASVRGEWESNNGRIAVVIHAIVTIALTPIDADVVNFAR